MLSACEWKLTEILVNFFSKISLKFFKGLPKINIGNIPLGILLSVCCLDSPPV